MDDNDVSGRVGRHVVRRVFLPERATESFTVIGPDLRPVELVEYWRMAAEDAKRLGGELPNSLSPGKRVMLVRRPRGSARTPA
jgi:hypothetical protein